MLNTIKKFFTGFNNYPVVQLGRWNIKHEIDHCNRYMQHLHADPGYYSPYKKIIIEKNINNDSNDDSNDDSYDDSNDNSNDNSNANIRNI